MLSSKLLRYIAKFAKEYGLPDSGRRLVEALVSAFQAGWVGEGAGSSESVMDRRDEDSIRYIEEHGGELITNISEAGHRRAKQILEIAERDGLSVHELQEKFVDDWGGSPARGLVISRTELANALNSGEADRWEADGVKGVRIVDGTNLELCPTGVCPEANGKIVTPAEYKRKPTAHPNCQRYGVPIPFDENIEKFDTLED